MKEKIKSLFIRYKMELLSLKEYAKNRPPTPLRDKLTKVVFSVLLALYLFVAVFSCSTQASAQEEENYGIMPTADEPTESDQVIIPAGVYIGRPTPDIDTLVSLGSQTFVLPQGFISYSCVQTYDSGPYDLYINQPLTNLWIVVNENTLDNLIGFCNNSFGAYAFAWEASLSYNNIIMALAGGDLTNPEVAFASVPIIYCSQPVSVDTDVATAFNAIFESAGSGGTTPPQECPTVEELLANMSGQDALQALYNSNSDATMIIAQGAADAYNTGKSEGLTEGYNTGYEYGLEQSGKFSGNIFTDIVGNVMEALDGFVIYQDQLVSISLLTVIRSLIAVFALIWILKLIAGG